VHPVPNLLTGILVQPTRDKITITRTVYSFSAFLNDFGAWAQAMIFIAVVLTSLLHVNTLESYLIHKLYRTEDRTTPLNEDATPLETYKLARNALSKRKAVPKLYRPLILTKIRNSIIKRLNHWKCCNKRSWLKATSDELDYLAAQKRLARELDVKKFIKKFRILSNSLSSLFTHEQERLLKM